MGRWSDKKQNRRLRLVAVGNLPNGGQAVLDIRQAWLNSCNPPTYIFDLYGSPPTPPNKTHEQFAVAESYIFSDDEPNI